MAAETRASFAALEDFRRARRRAALEQIMARIQGRSADLLSYEEVRRTLQLESQVDRGLQSIPLKAIVGSVGRYRDFTRSFLPRSDQLAERWARVQTVATDDQGWPPIEVYQIGDGYFVQDGNHRVSVARQMGLTHIQAYVTEVRTKLPLTTDTTPDDLICKAEYDRFLQDTGIKTQRPDANLIVSVPGAYLALYEHIAVHRHFLGLEQERFIPLEEAAAHWYDTVYQPIVEIMAAKGLLEDFPGRTAADLYLWLSEHRAELQNALGWDIQTGAAADHLAAEHSPKVERRLSRVAEKVRVRLLPVQLETGTAAGTWRRSRLDRRQDDRLFVDILVPVDGQKAGWRALQQAIVIAQKEDSQLRGLHIMPEKGVNGGTELSSIQDTFRLRCDEAGVEGHLVVETGQVASQICDRARWNDLVVLSLLHPPGKSIIQRLSSGFRAIVQNCPRPILTVPREVSSFQRGLLAYDGGPKSEEALFIAAYLSIRWGSSLVILTAGKNLDERKTISERAVAYLEEKGLAPAAVETCIGAPADMIMRASLDYSCDLILMGGYGAAPAVELVIGSTTNEVLRRAQQPVLICQ